MTPEQMQMMQLQNYQEPTQDLDPINEGLSRTVNYMNKNWPTTPFRRGAAKVMTKVQYKEQMMNEAAGYPSNLDEAARVVALEEKVQSVDLKLDQILGALVPQHQRENQAVTICQETGRATYSPVAPPPTLRARLAVATSPPPQLLQTNPLPAPTSPPPAPVMGLTTLDPQVPVSQLVSSTPPLQPQVFPETRVPAKPVPMSLGSVGAVEHENGQLGKDEILALDDDDSLEGPFPNEPVFPIANLIAEESAVDVEAVKKLERQQILTDQVTEWLGGKDPHKFWRQFVGGACNKNLSYNTWPKEFQGPFNERFGQMLKDPCFVSNICGRILKMQNGHMVGPHIAGAFVTVIAGFLSFALIEV